MSHTPRRSCPTPLGGTPDHPHPSEIMSHPPRRSTLSPTPLGDQRGSARAGLRLHTSYTLCPMTDKAARLQELHKTPPILVLPNAWDAVSARIVEAEGFPAVATTSAGVAASLGYPDGAAVPPNEMIEAVARIARAVAVPVSADVEHGYATTPDALADVVLRVIAAGA